MHVCEFFAWLLVNLMKHSMTFFHCRLEPVYHVIQGQIETQKKNLLHETVVVISVFELKLLWIPNDILIHGCIFSISYVNRQGKRLVDYARFNFPYFSIDLECLCCSTSFYDWILFSISPFLLSLIWLQCWSNKYCCSKQVVSGGKFCSFFPEDKSDTQWKSCLLSMLFSKCVFIFHRTRSL